MILKWFTCNKILWSNCLYGTYQYSLLLSLCELRGIFLLFNETESNYFYSTLDFLIKFLAGRFTSIFIIFQYFYYVSALFLWNIWKLLLMSPNGIDLLVWPKGLFKVEFFFHFSMFHLLIWHIAVHIYIHFFKSNYLNRQYVSFNALPINFLSKNPTASNYWAIHTSFFGFL